MSLTPTLPPDQTVSHPPGRRRLHPSEKRFRAQFATLLLTLLILLSGLVQAPAPAQAASLGVGWGDESLWIGSYSAHGRQTYCMDIAALPPWGTTEHPQLTTTLDSLSATELARLNYTLGKWGESLDPAVTSAVQLYVWDVADHATYVSRGGDGHFIQRVPEAYRGTVLGHLGTMRAEASANAVTDPAVGVSLAMSDQYVGQLTVTTKPASLTGQVTLTNGTFSNGSSTATLGRGTHQITGVPPAGSASYRVTATMTASAAKYGAGVDLFYTPGEQRILGAASFAPLTATASTPEIPMDFQPELTTQVASKFVQAGDPMVDGLDVRVTKHSWIQVGGKPVPVVADGVLYGPFDAQPAEANAPPEGAPVAGREQLTLTRPGGYQSPGTIRAPEAGFYTWVWSIDKEKQGANAKYLTGSFTDRFGRVAETAITPFQPEAVSRANGKLVKPGDRVTDTITVSSTNGVWLKHNSAPIPVIFEGTAYQVPGALPPVQGSEIPEDAVPLETVQVTATGPGEYTSPEVVLPDGGFVTWVWKVSKATQPEWVRPYLAADWQDDYGINVESHSVRWPLEITSEVREYNVHAKGRAFDRVTVSGFPDDHPEFEGDGYWKADEKTMTHTVYGPFESDTELTDDLDLGAAPVLTRITTPAKNGVYDLGYSDADRIQPTEPGYYVVVSQFKGDDRVQPFTSSPADIRERFFVPGKDQPVTVITQAQPSALVGDPFEDTALVQGTDIPAGAYLVFRAYGPQPDGEAPSCEAPFFTSEEIPVTQAGTYRSGATSTDRPGNVYWVETLYERDGTVITAGTCGAPGETTVVSERPPGSPKPPSPETPPVPPLPELPTTGASDWLPLGIGVGAAAILLGATLLMGRKLAKRRRADEPGEEVAIEELM